MEDDIVYFGGRRGVRGKKKFCFTYADIAELFGVREDTVRHEFSKRGLGRKSLKKVEILKYLVERGVRWKK